MSNSLRAIAGTLESNDIFITISPGETKDNAVSLESIVMRQFGPAIIETILVTLNDLGMQSVHVTAKDKGALDWTIKARVEAAAMRYREMNP